MDIISPKYQIDLVKKINDRLFELFISYEDVSNYIEKWHYIYEGYTNYTENFCIHFKDNARTKIDTKRTLHNIDVETLLKMAIDLGIETPDYIPSISMFKNELKSNYTTASQIFEKAFKNVENDPSLAIGLANSTLESIIKEILKDERLDNSCSDKSTLKSLVNSICKAYKLLGNEDLPSEIKTICSSLINACKAIEDLRSDKTVFHGKTDSNYLISEPLYAYFIVNASTTVGLFLLNFYKKKWPPKALESNTDKGLPF